MKMSHPGNIVFKVSVYHIIDKYPKSPIVGKEIQRSDIIEYKYAFRVTGCLEISIAELLGKGSEKEADRLALW